LPVLATGAEVGVATGAQAANMNIAINNPLKIRNAFIIIFLLSGLDK
jgi:hypothetical protein